MKTARTIIMTLSSVVAVFVLAVLVAVPAQGADLLEHLNIEPTDTTPGDTTAHTFQFTTSTNTDIPALRISYCTNASGTCGQPGGGAGTFNAAATTMSNGTGITTANWDLVSSSAYENFWTTGTAETWDSTTVVEFDLGNVANPAITDCNASSNNSSSTCYVRVRTYSDITGSTLVDSNVGTITVVADVTVSATVDPSFTFVVGAVGASTANNAITTSVSSTYSSLPFGNLTASTPKYAAHKLTVTTNANNGYSIYSEIPSGSPINGLYGASNNIDPFTAGWSASTTWTEPTGSVPSANTGWIGANTTDTGVTTALGGDPPDEAGEFGAIGTTPALVSWDADQDDGTTSVYVTYAMEVNFYQPADTYSGTLQYTALPSY